MTQEAQPARRYDRPGNRWRSLLWLVVIGFVGGAIAMTFFVRQLAVWMPSTAQAILDSAPADGKAEAVKAFTPPPEQGAVQETFDREMLGARQTTLAAQLASLEARAAAIVGTADAAAGNAGRAERLLTAFAARRAIDRGLPLGPVEAELQRQFGASQPHAVAIIIKAARAPVTLDDLRMGLDDIAPLLTSGASTDGWWASLRRELAGLVVIRREGTPSPRPVARLSRIRRLIDAQKIDIALAEVARLPGAAQAGKWQGAAQHYAETQKALDLIELTVLMSPPVSATPPTAPGAAQPAAAQSAPPPA
ncbi:MAG: hypothetical protein WC803_12095 [Sphingomonas sp.]|jgi:hypothetical protein